MGTLIKSNLPNHSTYRSGKHIYIWTKKGDILDIPIDVVNEGIFQRQIAKGLLTFPTEEEKILFILAGGKIRNGI